MTSSVRLHKSGISPYHVRFRQSDECIRRAGAVECMVLEKSQTTKAGSGITLRDEADLPSYVAVLGISVIRLVG